MTDTNETSSTETKRRSEATERNRRDGQKTKERDHRPPVEGARNSFERGNEGRTGDDAEEGASDEKEAKRRALKMKDRDHTSPVEDVQGVFERGAVEDVPE